MLRRRRSPGKQPKAIVLGIRNDHSLRRRLALVIRLSQPSVLQSREGLGGLRESRGYLL